MGNYKIGDEETRGAGEGMYRFPLDAVASPGQVIVIANLASDFIANYHFRPDYELAESDPDIPNMIRYEAWASGSVSLGNLEDELLLLNADDLVIDALSYGSSTWAFDPACPDVPAGHSLERVPGN